MDPQWLAEQVAKGRADKDIASELGMTASALGYWRRRFKIPPRPLSERTKASIRERFPNGRRGADTPHWKGGRYQINNGYVRVCMPDHPAAKKTGWVFEHRLVMERILGRYLRPEEVVDHIDQNRSNNAPENLRLHASSGEHISNHFNGRGELADTLAKLRMCEAENERLRRENEWFRVECDGLRAQVRSALSASVRP